MLRYLASRLTRRVAWLCVVGVVALILTGLTATSARAAEVTVVPPGAPPPLNILPSTIKGALPVSGATGSQNFLATLLYKFSKSPQFWQAVQAQQAGTATAAQVQTVTQGTSGFRVPATAVQVLAKGATAIGGYFAGAQLGNGLLDLVGFDAEGAVCGNTTGFVQTAVSLLTATDCSAWHQIPAEFAPNTDVIAGTFYGESCNGTYCVEIVAAIEFQYRTSPGTSAQLGSARYYCAETTPALTSGTIQVGHRRVGETGVTLTSFSFTTGSGTVGNPPTPWVCPGGTSAILADNRSMGPAGSSPVWPDFRPVIEEWMLVQPSQSGTDVIDCLTGGACTGFEDEIAVPTQTSGDPERALRCVLVMSSGPDLTMDSATFRESDGVLPQVRCPEIPEGLELEAMEIREVNLEDGTWSTLWSETTTPEYQAHQELAPECSNGTCLLDLRKSDVSCFQTPEDCAAWFLDPDRATKYSCWYGTHAVDLSECFVYAPTFTADARATGNLYGDPETGQVIGAPAGASPGTDGGYFGSPTQDPLADRKCFPEGWGVLNPVEWVFRPVACALEWAFVPRTATINQSLTNIAIAWANTPPGKVQAVVASWVFVPPGSGCGGITVDLGFLPADLIGEQSVTFFDACPGDLLADFAAFVKVLLMLGVIIAGVISILKSIAGVVQYDGGVGS